MTMKIRTIVATVTAAYPRPDGTIWETNGFDAATGIYAHLPVDWKLTPPKPTHGMLVAALRAIWKPWSKYLFASDHDRAAMLAAIFSAVCRPALETAPGFFFDAPTQASGKTKCAGAVGALATGERNGAMPFVAGSGAEAETVKKLVAMALSGAMFWLIDNVVGTWRSAVVASLITDGKINERLLGGNSWFRGSVRMLVTATGNNATLDRDLGRRLIRVRIDPKVECPQSRSFTFDPIDEVLRTRDEIVRAALTVIRGFVNAGAPQAGRGDAGFRDWNFLIRNSIIWVGSTGLATDAEIGILGDPAHSIMEASAGDDPDTAALKMLLSGLHQAFMNIAFSAKEVLREYERIGADNLIRDSVTAFLGRGDHNAIAIGKMLQYRRDRITASLVLRHDGTDRNGTARWRVEHA
ncbi:MAG: hypothetical protein V4578_16815 [Pseudomonadota bacterium]